MLNVIDQLTNTTMLRSTSIVSKTFTLLPNLFSTSSMNDYSIGMDCFKKGLTMQMVLSESLNAQSSLATRSSTNSRFQTRQERFGTIHIMVGIHV